MPACTKPRARRWPSIESDVRMAGYWGLAHRRANVAIHPSFAFPARCGGAPWVTDVDDPIDGTNNRYLSRRQLRGSAGGAQPGADVLIVRRASARADRTVEHAPCPLPCGTRCC